MNALPSLPPDAETLVLKLVQQIATGIQLMAHMEPDTFARLRLWTEVYGLGERLGLFPTVWPVLDAPDEVAHVAQDWEATRKALLAEVDAYHATRGTTHV
jgi:hypothetical protein